ncbi:MAG: membrane protein insertion efficiency factor YidD [Oscillospiraceae bacterium]|nr:membrane protein insertion efficiency factor YidD [Oscillospiraceae bacterium]
MKYVLALLIRFYRKCISPLFPPCCRYYPSCSAYALTAIERFGACRGFVLAFWRLLRCNPWSRGGVDEVPETFTLHPKISYPSVSRQDDRASGPPEE